MKKYLKMVTTAVMVITLIVGCYYYMSHRTPKAAEDDVEVTQMDEVLAKNLDSAYPPTPREVVKFYNRIIECAYSGGYDEKQFDGLVAQARKLMDEELLEHNPQDDYGLRLQEEVLDYQNASREILQTRVCASDEVRSFEREGRKCSFVEAAYFMREGKKSFLKTYQGYLLRQDSKGNWKILAYGLTDGLEDL